MESIYHEISEFLYCGWYRRFSFRTIFMALFSCDYLKYPVAYSADSAGI